MRLQGRYGTVFLRFQGWRDRTSSSDYIYLPPTFLPFVGSHVLVRLVTNSQAPQAGANPYLPAGTGVDPDYFLAVYIRDFQAPPRFPDQFIRYAAHPGDGVDRSRSRLAEAEVKATALVVALRPVAEGALIIDVSRATSELHTQRCAGRKARVITPRGACRPRPPIKAGSLRSFTFCPRLQRSLSPGRGRPSSRPRRRPLAARARFGEVVADRILLSRAPDGFALARCAP
jgi:hypothetical protein